MSRSSSSSSWAASLTPAILALLLLVPIAVPSLANAQISGVYVGATQEVPDPIPPCITSGFAVDATLSYDERNGTITRFHRIDRAQGNPRIGYIVLTNGVTNERRLIVYNGTTMAMLAETVIQLSGNIDYGQTQLAGEVVGGSLFLFRLVNNGRIGCAAPAGNPCVSLSKYNARGLLLGETVVGSLVAQNLDDVRMNGSSTLILLYNNGSQRALMSFSVPGGSFISQSAGLGVANTGELALNADAGYQYIGYYNVARTVQQIQLDSVTVHDASTFAFNAANTLGALMVIPVPGYVVGYSVSFGGFSAVENYRNAITLEDIGTVSAFSLTDGSAVNRSTFWDSVNQRIYSWRADAGSGLTGQLMRLVAGSGLVEQRFSCGPGCLATSVPSTDFVVSNARLYNAVSVGSGTGTVTRIKVCATGGPPA